MIPAILDIYVLTLGQLRFLEMIYIWIEFCVIILFDTLLANVQIKECLFGLSVKSGIQGVVQILDIL